MAPIRRKSRGSIRSPHVKRDSQSQVAIEGWLYKLEGGTIKQWKQRWCVLADFCLFVYKGPHEDKVSSSVLLPSYRISPCSTDDRTSKKFSFKAEHQNMKTFFFAAEDKETMRRWMNMMSLATIMQKCALSDQFDLSFSSVSYDDEDSGFTSHYSRRFKSSEHNSTLDSCFSNSEQIRQRSNSYGDKMAEVHLRSDDKYPTVYKSSSSHLYKASPNNPEGPRRQPLYANAPPKPKRLTQSDPFAISPGERYDAIDHDLCIIDSSQYHDRQLFYSHHMENHKRNYHSSDPTTSFNDSVFHDPDAINFDASFSQHSNFQSIPELHKTQPPRPHSADFLERDTDDFTSVPVNYFQEPQPQRPKSSLECYNRFWKEEEEVEFDAYREAVRAQADNFYANNKNVLRNKNFHAVWQPANEITNSELTLQIPTVGNSYPVQQPDGFVAKVGNCARERLPSGSSDNNSYAGHFSSKRSHEESMKKLLEWKQRMLQSPFSRQSNAQANTFQGKQPLSQQNEYKWRVLQELESHEANLQNESSFNSLQCDIASPGYVSQNQYLSGNQLSINNPKNSYEVQNYHHGLGHDAESVDDQFKVHHGIMPDKFNAGNNLDANCEPNVMYCVDSENNEIIFSSDNSAINHSESKPIQQTQCSPQMHSFSTMSNVNDISNDAYIIPESGKHQRSRNFAVLNQYQGNNSHEHKGSAASRSIVITYSSDDEASADSDNKHQSNKCKHTLRKLNDAHSSEFKCQEPLRKLVKHSEGLMTKGKRLSVSAGDLLGKTHEELVLLLIQLRRNQSKLHNAKEKCQLQFGNEQLIKMSSDRKSSSKNYNELLRQVQQLESQYDITQPLVTLVDNMVKLGSLYGTRCSSCPRLDIASDEKSDFVELHESDDQKHPVILSKLLAEENNLQRHMTEIYCLDKGLRHETNSITSLQQDKEMLESTLYGMRNKILDHQDRPVELQKLRKQHKMIEKELLRVKKLLSNSAKKIEHASLKNDQLEQEILLLRKKLQQALKTDASETHNRADLEAELTRVQNVLEELANHRHEINNTVEELKWKPCSKVEKAAEVRASPTGVAGSAPLPLRKKQHSMYLETDLDTMITRDLAIVYERDLDDIPVYVNADEINNPNADPFSRELNVSSDSMQMFISQSDSDCNAQCPIQDINDADERMKRFYGILPKEKPCEIKTVRIVKRQSERRNKDKKRVTYDDDSAVWIMEEPDLSSDDLLETDEGNSRNVSASPSSRPSNLNLLTSSNQLAKNSKSAHERLFGKKESIALTGVKRSKRRHYTVSGYQYMLDPQFSQYFGDRPRARDDVDMERCLRTANTPDIVRSTIKKEVFDEAIIERELGLPDKISIPERYIENEPEQLSAGEKLRRTIKAENIRKMLSETTTTYGDAMSEERSKSPESIHKKLSEEKKKRAHLLSLNRALAKEVAEKTKAVAANVYSADSP